MTTPDATAQTSPRNPLRRWEVVGVLATLAIVLAVPLRLAVVADRDPKQPARTVALYVGSDACKSCHQAAYDKWRGSNHALAMAPAREDTVLGDFNDATFTEKGKTTRFSRKDGKYLVHTEGPDGTPGDFEVAYTFGWFPLQQYLIPFPGGRLQALTIAWDVQKKRWYSLYPDQVIPPTDWLHWTRPAQNWNVMCSECHSTGVRKRYDPEHDTYQTTWSEVSVGCEACHGPGSLHVEWAKAPPMARLPAENVALPVKTSGLTGRDLVNLCGPSCHARRSGLRDQDRPGGEPLDVVLPVLLAPGLFYPDGQILEEDYEYHSFLQSKMYATGVKCSDCHDVHSAKRHKDGNDLCVRCHRADTYDTDTHHFHKKVVKGRPSEGASCVACHMPGRNYMGVHFRRDHSLRVPRPDLSAQLGTPNSCSQSGCHADKPLKWVVQAYNKWYGVKRKPHYGTVLAAARERKPEARAELLELAADRLRPAIVRATALDLLWVYPGEESTRLLQQALTDEDALIRRTAAHHVRFADPTQLVKVLAPLLRDPALAVRTEAASRLAEVPQTYFTESPGVGLQGRSGGVPEGPGVHRRHAVRPVQLGDPGAEPGPAGPGGAAVPQGSGHRRPVLPGADEPRSAPESARQERRGGAAPEGGPPDEPPERRRGLQPGAAPGGGGEDGRGGNRAPDRPAGRPPDGARRLQPGGPRRPQEPRRGAGAQPEGGGAAPRGAPLRLHARVLPAPARRCAGGHDDPAGAPRAPPRIRGGLPAPR